MAPRHYLNQCFSKILWHSAEGNFTGNTQDIPQDIHPWYVFNNNQIKITAASPRGQWVKPWICLCQIKVQLSASIMRSNLVRYCINDCRNSGRILIRCWIHKRHPIPRANGQAMGCLLWIFFLENWLRYNGTALYDYVFLCMCQNWSCYSGPWLYIQFTSIYKQSNTSLENKYCLNCCLPQGH